jgi:hypothetical protein
MRKPVPLGCFSQSLLLAGANPDGGAGFGHAIPGNVKLGNVTPTVNRRWQQPQEREMLQAPDPRADRPGALHQHVLRRRAREAELERELPTGVSNSQLDHRVAIEDRLGGWEIELGQAEVGAPGIQAHKQVLAIEAHAPACFGYEVFLGSGGAPGGLLLRGQCTPADGDRADVVTVGLLRGGAGVSGAHILSRDLAVTAIEINDGALAPRLGNGADFHVIAGARLPRRGLSRPQSGRCSKSSTTRTNDPGGIHFSREERGRRD